jgi:hypothetical protein
MRRTDSAVIFRRFAFIFKMVVRRVVGSFGWRVLYAYVS